MSATLDALKAIAEDKSESTVRLSPMTLTVLFFAMHRLDARKNWIDTLLDPLDEISAGDWDEIQDIRDNAYLELMTETPMYQVGEIRINATPEILPGWLACDGSEISRTGYPELFNALGTAFGIGDGSTTFNLPNFNGRSPIGAGFPDVPFDMGTEAGEYEHTLTTDEIPSHNHPPLTGAGFLERFNGGGTTSIGTQWGQSATTGNTGGGLPHNNLHPVLGVVFLVWSGVVE